MTKNYIPPRQSSIPYYIKLHTRFLAAFDFMFGTKRQLPKQQDASSFFESVFKISGFDNRQLLLSSAPLTIKSIYDTVLITDSARTCLGLDKDYMRFPQVSHAELADMIKCENMSSLKRVYSEKHSIIKAFFLNADCQYRLRQTEKRLQIAIDIFGENDDKSVVERKSYHLASEQANHIHVLIDNIFLRPHNGMSQTEYLDVHRLASAIECLNKRHDAVPKKSNSPLTLDADHESDDEDDADDEVDVTVCDAYVINDAHLKSDWQNITDATNLSNSESDLVEDDAQYISAKEFYDQMDMRLWNTCPLTNAKFENPVIGNDQITYEKVAIENWLKTSNKSPMIKDHEMTVHNLRPNNLIKNALEVPLI